MQDAALLSELWQWIMEGKIEAYLFDTARKGWPSLAE
jgi:hypothetical protein